MTCPAAASSPTKPWRTPSNAKCSKRRAIPLQSIVSRHLQKKSTKTTHFAKQFPDYTHRIYHVFLAHLLDSPRRDPTETDRNQRASEWHTLEEASSLPVLYPRGIGTLLSGVPEVPVYLGTCFIE